MPAAPVSLRDRIVEFRRVRGADITPHPMNPRSHPPLQRERLRAILSDIGVAGVLLTYHSERNGGVLSLIDGELRATDHPETEWPCAITDLTDAEADLLLLTHDPLAALAEYTRQDRERMLLDGVTTGDAVLQAFVSELAEGHGIIPGSTWSPGGEPPDPDAHWQGMPAFEQEDQEGVQQIIVHFATLDDVEAFAALVEQPITEKTRSLWYPAQTRQRMTEEFVSDATA